MYTSNYHVREDSQQMILMCFTPPTTAADRLGGYGQGPLRCTLIVIATNVFHPYSNALSFVFPAKRRQHRRENTHHHHHHLSMRIAATLKIT